MDLFRIWHTLMMYFIKSGQGRARYLKKHNVLYHTGDNCMVMFRKIPLYPKLISLGDNVWIASDVLLVTHDAIHRVLNNFSKGELKLQENLGCIDIKDNVFVGSNSTILPNVTIGPNTIIAAGSVVNKSLPGDGVYGGVPAKYICSFDEFVEKRKKVSPIEIKRNRFSGLTDDSIENCWQRFYNTKNGGKSND